MRCEYRHTLHCLRAARLITVGAALALSLVCEAGTFIAKVVVVVDGDTVVVRDERAGRHEIRVAGIDAPEIRQPYGVRSRSYMAELLYGRQVTVVWYKRDRYNRVLARLYVMRNEPCGTTVCPRTVDAGYAQVAAGYAWHDKEHLDEQPVEDRARYSRAEQDARARRAGLWAESVPMPPWRFRHLHPRRLSERMQFH